MTVIDRKAKLIDSLLLTEGYVSHWFHFWADILEPKRTLVTECQVTLC